MSVSRRRFYKDVSVDGSPAAQRSYRVLLDGKPVRTPNGAILALPCEALAQALAQEWRAQESVIRPETMTLTKLANTAIDRVAPNPEQVREQTLSLAKSDVVCYRAETPSDLAERQQRAWDPLLAWLREGFGASLRAAAGLTFIEQDEAALDSVRAMLSQRDSFFLAGLYAAAALTGSLVIALALAERRLDAEQAFASANLDKIYQAERWGWDAQERAKVDAERAELNRISRFLELLPT